MLPPAPLSAACPPKACHSFTATAQDDAFLSFRPVLKRQATAPMPAFTAHNSKKPRDTVERGEKLWSSEVHTAFLEALQHHPSNSSWRDRTFEEGSLDDQTEYCTIIQEYILRKTGRPQRVNDIQVRLHDVFNELQVSSPIELPSPSVDTTQTRSEFVSQLLCQDVAFGQVDDKFLLDLDSSQSDSASSMSRRRQACNRPTLKLHVQIPPYGMASDAPVTGSTPLTASFHPFKLINAMENGLAPTTPVDKCAHTPDGPPEIPRMLDVRHAMIGRWLPTPTEGVLPMRSTCDSPDAGLSTISSDSDGSDSTRSSLTEGRVGRPNLGVRNGSWLSFHKGGKDGSGYLSSALSSPFATPFPPTSPN